MTKYVNSGEGIECAQSVIAVRWISQNPTLIKTIGLDGRNLRLFKYKTKKRGIVQNTAELSPKECIMCKTSGLDLGDELEGDTLEIFTENRVKFNVVSNFSHVHGIQGDSVNFFTYAKIVMPFRFVLEKRIVDIA